MILPLWRSKVPLQTHSCIRADGSLSNLSPMEVMNMDEPGGETQLPARGTRRRDFINIAAGGVAVVGGAALLYPLVNPKKAPKDVRAVAPIYVDISRIRPGQAVRTTWRYRPVFIRHLTPEEIAAANAVDLATLRDPQTLAQRTVDGRLEWLITLGVCTHLGCVPLGVREGENRGAYGGYFCPCHGAHFDTAGRVRKGPALRNLEVPEYRFTSPTTVQIG